MSGTKKIILLIFVCLALIVALVVVLNDYSTKNEEKRKELEVVYESLYEDAMIRIEERENLRKEEKRQQSEKELSFSPYEKLNESTMLTSIFYLGDRIAYGKGLADTDNSWKMLLREKYEKFPGESYRIEGTQSTERPEGGTFGHLDKLFEVYRVLYDLDLMFLCVGTQGEVENFGAEYEILIRKAKEMNPNGDVICVIEHNQVESEANAILELCEHYELPFVDMRPHFVGRETELTFEDGYPNEAGHQLYADKVFEVLEKAVEEKIGPKEYKKTGVFLSKEEIQEIEEYGK